MAPKKPEWFEIAENDRPAANTFEKRKSFPRPIIALAVSGLIIGAGAIFANAEEEGPAAAETPNVTHVAASVKSSDTTNSKSHEGPVVSTATNSGVSNPATQQDRLANPMTNENRVGDGEFGEHHGDGERLEHGARPFRFGHHKEGEHEDFEREDD